MQAMDFGKHFGRNLAAHRKEAGLSQEELGFRANLHRTEVGMLERGIRLPRIDTLIKVAGSLGVPPGDLLKGLDWTPRSATTGAFRIDEDDRATEQDDSDGQPAPPD
jgi:transcriptional regulator with XRE-family HTH domain